MQNLQILHTEELMRRLSKLRRCLVNDSTRFALVSTNTNLFYLSGRVFSGFVFIDTDSENLIYFVRRPVDLGGNNVLSIHKLENIPEILQAQFGIEFSPERTLGLELDSVPYSAVTRIQKAFNGASLANISGAVRTARSVKTPYEIQLLKESGVKHSEVYHAIPSLYTEGMTDVELQIAIENKSRLEGCLGQFRISGNDMEIFMGNILAGDNADTPSPYDFAMGGGGQHPSLPVGANGTILREGMSVMVDMNGNFTAYMTDMTRTFSVGKISPKAVDAHKLSMDICHEIQCVARPGTEAKVLYELAIQMVEGASMKHYFMGHRQQAGFIGHGIGLEVNEMPVLAPRSRNILEVGNVIALEPKFVIPGTGAVGIENTYVVRENGLECITNCPEEIIDLQ